MRNVTDELIVTELCSSVAELGEDYGIKGLRILEQHGMKVFTSYNGLTGMPIGRLFVLTDAIGRTKTVPLPSPGMEGLDELHYRDRVCELLAKAIHEFKPVDPVAYRHGKISAKLAMAARARAYKRGRIWGSNRQ